MKIRLLLRACLALALTSLTPSGFATLDLVNDDTDIFLANPAITAERPNVLIILDNTANWNQPFTLEKTALVNVANSLSDQLNVGLMMFTETGGGNGTPGGAYVRYAVRQMTGTNKAAFTGVVNSLDINSDKSNGGKMALSMYEAFQYYAGGVAYAGGNKVKRDYAGNAVGGPAGAVPGSFPNNAFTSSGSTTYVSPITDGCQKNFIIYISNGKAQDNNSDLSVSQSALTALNNGVTPPTITLSNTSPDSSSQQGNWADEWARFMANNDCNQSIPGVQKVFTYTIDVGPANVTDPSTQGAGWTTLLKSTAASGGGKYFAISSTDPNEEASLELALTTIFNEVQSVNSVFAATTLPVSVNVRGTNLNQVYIGVFRPDAQNLPRWFGNLKMYKLGLNTATNSVFLADANGNPAENTATGFISNSAESFWTTASSMWAFRGPVFAATDVGGASDLPDGDLVEKGGAAERIRNLFPSAQGARNVYTCTSASGGICASGSPLSATPFSAGGSGNPGDNSDILAADLGAYLSYTVTSLTSADNGNGTATVTANLGSIPNPLWSNGDTVRIGSVLTPGRFNGDFTIANFTTDPVAGTASFTYQIGTVPAGNLAVVVTPSPHQLRTGDLVTVTGAVPAVYNVSLAPVTVLSSTKFTYTLPSSPSGPATSLPTMQGMKVVSAITGTGTSATATIPGSPSNGYTGVSITNFSITGSSVSAFNSVSGNIATNSPPSSVNYTTTTTITGTASTAKVSAIGHELLTGDVVTVTGSNNGYNATNAVVTVLDANTFTYTPVGPIGAPNTGSLTIVATRNIDMSATDSPARSIITGSTGGTKNVATGNTGSFVHNLSTNFKATVTCASPSGFNQVSATITLPTSTSFSYGVASSIGQSVTATVAAGCTSIDAAFSKTVGGVTAAIAVTTDTGSGMYAVTTFTPSSVAVQTSGTGSPTAGRPSDADPSLRANIINWIRGQDNSENENQDCTNSPFFPCTTTNNQPRLTDIRTSVHGDVLHSRPAVVNYNRIGDDNDVTAFYGGNDGMLHALKGGTGSNEAGVSAGDERWTFIPREFFANLGRLRANTPAISSTDPKPYFADGPIGIYQNDANNDGRLTTGSGDQVYIYAGFNRGGRVLYALDVTDPSNPTLLWRKTSADSGYAELGQTWSLPSVTRLAANIGNPANPNNVVLIFGGGYDSAVDDVNPCELQSVDANSVTRKRIGSGTVDYSTPAGSCTINNATGSPTVISRTQGRAIFVVDAFNGNVVWQAGPAPSGAANNQVVAGMTCAIPSDLTVIDRDRNGTADWLYAGDTCGNLWRVDIANPNIGSWQVNKLASVSSSTGSDIANHRKFLFPADAVASSDA